MNIRKFGKGASLPAYITYIPIQTTDSNVGAASAAIDQSSKESKSEKKITDADLVKALDQLDALPNEVKAITTDIQNFLYNQSFLGEIDPTQLSMQYAALVGKMKVAKFNSEQYKEAFNQIKSNGGINEIAIDTDGYIYCRSRQDPNDFERFTAQEYMQNYKDYKAVTNQELLELRAQSPGLIDNNEVLKVVANGMGIQAIQQLINNAINKIGTTTMQQQGYSQTQATQIARGVEYLQEVAEQTGQNPENGMQVDGIYNLNILSKDQQQQAKLALTYIYSTLPKNARTLLEVKAAESGIPGGAYGLLGTLVQSKLDITNTEKMQRSNEPSSKKSKSKDVETMEGVNPAFAKLTLTPVMMAQLGLSERKKITTIHGGKYAASNYAQVVPIVNNTGTPLGASTTLLDVSQSQLAGALNLEDATMGGARIDQAAFMKVAITGGNMYIMNVPIDKSRSDGVIAPDLKYLKRLEEAEEEVNRWKQSNPNKDITADAINAIYKKYNLPVLMDSNGNINLNNYCKFAVFNGETKDKYLIPPPDGSDIIAQDITSEDNVKNYQDILSGNKEAKNQEDFDFNNWFDFDGHDTLYRATVFIPLSTNILSGAATSGEKLQVKDAVGIYELNEQKERLKNYDSNRASKYEE